MRIIYNLVDERRRGQNSYQPPRAKNYYFYFYFYFLPFEWFIIISATLVYKIVLFTINFLGVWILQKVEIKGRRFLVTSDKFDLRAKIQFNCMRHTFILSMYLVYIVLFWNFSTRFVEQCVNWLRTG